MSQTEQDNAYDPRFIANEILIECFNRAIHLSNLSLQKMLYFAHGHFLQRYNKPLVSGYFEAWTHGPVHPAVYQAFKRFGSEVIGSVALKKDVRTGLESELTGHLDDGAREIIKQVVEMLGSRPAGHLVRLSHAVDGPWDVVFRRTKREKMLGLRISNELIRGRFGYHKVFVTPGKIEGNLIEDSPLTSYGFG